MQAASAGSAILAETLRPTRTPDLPWVEVATDIFEWERSNYLVTVDYYSKFIEVDKLENLSSAATIDALKSQMSRHGIAEKLRTLYIYIYIYACLMFVRLYSSVIKKT